MTFCAVKPVRAVRLGSRNPLPFRPAHVDAPARGRLAVRYAAQERPAIASGTAAAALAAALLFAPANLALADGGVVQTGPNFNAGLQAGSRQAAANTEAIGSAPTGEVVKNSPMVPSATKQTAQPGSLFKGLAKGAADTLRQSYSEPAAAQAFNEDPGMADSQKGYFAGKDLSKRVGQDPSPEEAAARTGTQGGDVIKDMARRTKASQ